METKKKANERMKSERIRALEGECHTHEKKNSQMQTELVELKMGIMDLLGESCKSLREPNLICPHCKSGDIVMGPGGDDSSSRVLCLKCLKVSLYIDLIQKLDSSDKKDVPDILSNLKTQILYVTQESRKRIIRLGLMCPNCKSMELLPETDRPNTNNTPYRESRVLCINCYIISLFSQLESGDYDKLPDPFDNMEKIDPKLLTCFTCGHELIKSGDSDIMCPRCPYDDLSPETHGNPKGDNKKENFDICKFCGHYLTTISGDKYSFLCPQCGTNNNPDRSKEGKIPRGNEKEKEIPGYLKGILGIINKYLGQSMWAWIMLKYFLERIEIKTSTICPHCNSTITLRIGKNNYCVRCNKELKNG